MSGSSFSTFPSLNSDVNRDQEVHEREMSPGLRKRNETGKRQNKEKERERKEEERTGIEERGMV